MLDSNATEQTGLRYHSKAVEERLVVGPARELEIGCRRPVAIAEATPDAQPNSQFTTPHAR